MCSSVRDRKIRTLDNFGNLRFGIFSLLEEKKNVSKSHICTELSYFVGNKTRESRTETTRNETKIKIKIKQQERKKKSFAREKRILNKDTIEQTKCVWDRQRDKERAKKKKYCGSDFVQMHQRECEVWRKESKTVNATVSSTAERCVLYP